VRALPHVRAATAATAATACAWPRVRRPRVARAQPLRAAKSKSASIGRGLKSSRLKYKVTSRTFLFFRGQQWAFAAVGPSRRPPDLCLFDLGSPGGVYSSRQRPSVAQGCRLLRAREVSWTFKNFQVNLENIDISDLHEKSRFVRTTEPQIGMGSRAQVSLAPPFVHCRPLRRPTRLSRRCWPSAPIRG
jgi:hypothetical protein